MRLTKPELQHRIPILADNRNSGFTVWPDADAGDQGMHFDSGGPSDADALDGIGYYSQYSVKTHLTDNLSLPTSFGEVYLGQTFRCCICVSNISSEPDLSTGAPTADTPTDLKNVELRVDMQLPTQRTVNAYDSVARGIRDRKVAPAESCEAVLIYEVKDLGMHTLVKHFCIFSTKACTSIIIVSFFSKRAALFAASTTSSAILLAMCSHSVNFLSFSPKNPLTCARIRPIRYQTNTTWKPRFKILQVCRCISSVWKLASLTKRLLARKSCSKC